MKKPLYLLTVLAGLLAAMASNSISGCGATENGSDSDADSDGDSDADSDTDSDADGTTIYDVQQGEVAEDETVTINGVVVTTPVHMEEGGVFVEEPEGGPYSGIYLYMYSDVLAEVDLVPGAEVNITGVYTEFFGYSEITIQSINDITVLGMTDIPAAEEVDPADVATGGDLAEAYEAVLVRIASPEVTDDTLGYGEWEISDSLIVDDFFFETSGGPSTGGIDPAAGDTFDGITGVLYLSFDEVKLEPRSAEDFENWSGGDADTDTDTDTDADADIYDLQQDVVAVGTLVELTGVIVTSPVSWNGEDFFVQEAAGGQYSGILIHNFDGGTDPADVEVGDVVTVSGFYTEFEGCSEVTVSDSSYVTVTGSTAVPAAALVAATDVATGGSLAENWEGVLVRVEDVDVTTAADAYGQFEVEGALLVDDIFFSGGGPDPTVGTNYASITGPLHYSFYDFKLEPRTLADLVD
jgi:DNA/RNA endonuclease YhcR with UshA esterase domain